MTETEEDEEDRMRRERIITWLLELKRETVERPLTPVDIEDEPPEQTDTALHIVYNGD